MSHHPADGLPENLSGDPLAGLTLPDDSTRPIAPELTNVTAQQRQPGVHLRMIHDHHRQNMATIRKMLDDIQAGRANATTLEDVTEPLQDMRQNYRQFGALCGQHCQIIHGHHSIEDAHIFPALSAKAKAFSKVVDRLKSEHEIVHELLVRLIAALNALFEDTNERTFDITKTLYDALDGLLASHFNYEEESIGDALGVYEIGV